MTTEKKEKRFNEVEQKYVDMTGSSFLSCDMGTEFDKSTTLRQIAYNIAHLADEVRALRKDCEEVGRYFTGSDLFNEKNEEEEKEETKEESKEESGEDKEESDKKETCFICGRKLHIRDAAGAIISKDNTRYCCDDCSYKFDRFVLSSFLRF